MPKISAGLEVIAASPACQGSPCATALPASWRFFRAWKLSENENAMRTPAAFRSFHGLHAVRLRIAYDFRYVGGSFY